MESSHVQIPLDDEQLSAEAGLISDKQQKVIDIQAKQVADRAQKWLDQHIIPAKVDEIQSGFEANRAKAIAARPVVQEKTVETKKTIWQKIFGE